MTFGYKLIRGYRWGSLALTASLRTRLFRRLAVSASEPQRCAKRQAACASGTTARTILFNSGTQDPQFVPHRN